MKFTIGDLVLLKRSGEEGHVTAYINQQMLEVEVKGTTFPVHLDEIDHPYLKWFTDKNKKKKQSQPEQLPVEKIAARQQRLAKGVYLSFMPVYKTEQMEEVVDQLKVYLLNEMAQPVKFAYDEKIAQKSEFKLEGTLHAFGNVYLHSIRYQDMNEQPRFHWQLTDPGNKDMAVEEGVLRIKPSKLFEHIQQMMEKNEPTFSYVLIEEFSVKKKPEPIEKFNPVVRPQVIDTVSAKNIQAAKAEVDLHIEALVKNKHGLTNAEIVKIQMDALEHYLHLAIVHRQERLIIIHGLGKGKLRDDIHVVLKLTPEVARFKNEWSGKYGFGATEVWFRY